MKVTEIRIGNIWGRPGRPAAIRADDFMNMSVNGLEYDDIPLTEEWLLNLGFTKCEDSYGGYLSPGYGEHKSKHLRVVESPEQNGLYCHPLGGHMGNVNLPWVHLLQNLFFGIAQQELPYDIKLLGE